MPNLVNQIVEGSAKLGFSLHKCQGCKGQEQVEGCSRLEETKEAWGPVGHVILDWILLTKGEDSWDGWSYCPGWGLTEVRIDPNFLTDGDCRGVTYIYPYVPLNKHMGY